MRTGLEFIPGECESGPGRTNRRNHRLRPIEGQALRWDQRPAAAVEGVEIDFVLTFTVVAPGQSDTIAVPGHVGANRGARRPRHPDRTRLDSGFQILDRS